MHEENASLIDAMRVDKESQIGSRIYCTGRLCDRDVVVVFSHWGKVAAAITATTLICGFGVDEIIFTGVAGALDEQIDIGDVVVAQNLYQHDMDARPIIARHEIPLLGKSAIATAESARCRLAEASELYLREDMFSTIDSETTSSFGITSPKVVVADIASGDQFISDKALSKDIRERLPTVACVEMEGAAVAQVCESFDVPFSLVRTISDGANESSEMDFQAFIAGVAKEYSLGIIKRYLMT